MTLLLITVTYLVLIRHQYLIEDLSMTISQTLLHKALFYPQFIDQETWGSALIFEAPYCSVTQLCLTPWIAVRQASLSFTISLSLLKLMSIESLMPSNHLIPRRPLLLLPSVFPSIRVFSSESALHIRWPNTGASASALVLPMNIQGWFLLGSTGLFSLLSKGLSGVFPSTTIWKHQFLGTQPSL